MGGKTSQSTQQVTIPPDVLARYNSVNAQAQDAAATPFQQYGGEFVAPVNQGQQAGISATNQAAGQAQPYYGAATQQLMGAQGAGQNYYGAATAATQGAYQGAQPYNQAATNFALMGAGPVNAQQIGGQQIGQFMSPYLGSVVGSEAALLNQNNQQAMSGQLGSAIQSGAFGGDRGGVAAANLAQQQQLANANIYSNLLNTGYGQALSAAQQQQGVNLSAEQANRAALQQASGQLAGIGQQGYAQGTGTGAQLASLGQGVYGMGAGTSQALAGLGAGAQSAALQGAQAQLGAGTLQQQTQQAQDTALYNQFLQQQSYPFQTSQFLANVAEGTGALSGSTTATTQPGGLLARGGTVDRRHARYAGGMVPSSEGGAVGYKHAGEGFAGGGMPMLPGLGAGDYADILQAQQQMYAPFSGAGIYGGPASGSPRGGLSYVPQANLPVSHLTTAGGLAPSPSALDQMHKFADIGNDVQSWLPKAHEKAANVVLTQQKNVLPPQTTIALPTQKTPPPDFNSDLPNVNIPSPSARGGVAGGRHPFADGGMPYSNQGGPAGLDIPEEAPQTHQLATAGALPQQQSGLGQLGALAGDVKGVIGAGQAVASAAPEVMSFLAALSTGGVANGRRPRHASGGVAGGRRGYVYGGPPQDNSDDETPDYPLDAGLAPQPKPDFNSAVNQTIAFEGGNTHNATENAKFGINQASHPNVKVGDLTKDQAKSIYHDQYWRPIGADNMAPDFAPIAFDTAVNIGVGPAKSLIAQSDGDSNKLLDLRQAYYDNLVQKNPDKYRPSYRGWSNRVNALRSTVTPPVATDQGLGAAAQDSSDTSPVLPQTNGSGGLGGNAPIQQLSPQTPQQKVSPQTNGSGGLGGNAPIQQLSPQTPQQKVSPQTNGSGGLGGNAPIQQLSPQTPQHKGFLDSLKDPGVFLPILTGIAAAGAAQTRSPLIALTQGLGAAGLTIQQQREYAQKQQQIGISQQEADTVRRQADTAQYVANTGRMNLGIAAMPSIMAYINNRFTQLAKTDANGLPLYRDNNTSLTLTAQQYANERTSILARLSQMGGDGSPVSLVDPGLGGGTVPPPSVGGGIAPAPTSASTPPSTQPPAASSVKKTVASSAPTSASTPPSTQPPAASSVKKTVASSAPTSASTPPSKQPPADSSVKKTGASSAAPSAAPPTVEDNIKAGVYNQTPQPTAIPASDLSNLNSDWNPSALYQQAKDLRTDNATASGVESEALALEKRAADIESGKIASYNKDGSQYLGFKKQVITAATAASVAANNANLANDANNKSEAFAKESPHMRQALSALDDVYKNLNTGRLSARLANFYGALDTLGIPISEHQKAMLGGADIAQKNAAILELQNAISSGIANRAPAAVMGQEAKTVAGPGQSADARYHITVQQKALLDQTQDYYKVWQKYKGIINDVSGFTHDWLSEHPISGYESAAAQHTPIYDGMSDAAKRYFVRKMLPGETEPQFLARMKLENQGVYVIPPSGKNAGKTMIWGKHNG